MRAVLLLLVGLTSLFLSACGGADLSSVAEAAEKTQEARTARLALTMQEAGQAEAESTAGAIDFPNRQLALDIPGLGEFVLDGSTMYISAPEYIQKFTRGKPWLKTDLEKEPLPGGNTALESLFDFLDPARLLGFLSDAADFEEMGNDEVRGVPTTHYRGMVDGATFMAEFAPEGEVPADAVDAEVGVDAWVGDDGLLRKVTYDVPALGDQAAVVLTIEFYDVGSDVGIEVPGADQVADLSEGGG